MWPDGYARIVLDTVGSTNAEALTRASGNPGRFWLMARAQTAGRGRRGRGWSTATGNFAATLVLPMDRPPGEMALRSFVAALALADALGGAGAEGLTLKWPNDVLLSGGKVAGILLEATRDHLAVGIGVNLQHAPGAETVEPGATPPVSLLQSGITLTQDALLDSLAEAWEARDSQFRTYGFAPVREAWLSRAARLGETITARTTRDTLTGRFETVDDTGSLVLKTAKGPVAIPAADVFF